MKSRARIVSVGAAIAATSLALTLVSSGTAMANSSSQHRAYKGGTLTAYVYIQDWSDWSGCGNFNTHASATTSQPYITNNVSWDPIGIGASASIQGVGVSVSGNNGTSPAATITNKKTTYAGISGVVCASWSTVYVGVFSTAVITSNGTLYPVSAHV